MRNRCVITTKDNWNKNTIGVYLHWNGGRDSVEAFLEYCKMKDYRTDDLARLCQVIGNFFGGTLSLEIGMLDDLDCDNWDNGVYIIENWEIVDRKYFTGSEQNEYDRLDALLSIDKAMPESERIADFINAEDVNIYDLEVGDMVCFIGNSENLIKARIVGIGEDVTVNGYNVLGVPYVDIYGYEGRYNKNVNNYLHPDRHIWVRKIVEE